MRRAIAARKAVLETAALNAKLAGETIDLSLPAPESPLGSVHPVSQVMDELGYLAIPPCLWGEAEEGLVAPVYLPYDANLTSIKRNNNTYTHYGEMASWQMRGVLAHQPALL